LVSRKIGRLIGALKLAAEGLRVRDIFDGQPGQLLGGADAADLKGFLICLVDHAAHYRGDGGPARRRQLRQLTPTLAVEPHLETFRRHVRHLQPHIIVRLITAACKAIRLSQQALLVEADEPPLPKDDVVQQVDAQGFADAGGVLGAVAALAG
jgi:hypothetical protein